VGLEAEGVWISLERLEVVRMEVAAAVTLITGKGGATLGGAGLAGWLLGLFGRIGGGRRAPR